MSLVLTQDNGSGLSTPIAGELGFTIDILNAIPPTPSPNLTGTWEGSIDCAGIADFTDTQSFSGPVELKVGARSGYSYGVELSDGAGGVIATYCAEYSSDLTVDSNQGTGRMISDDPAQPPTTVFLRARNNAAPDPATLKAREFLFLPDGSDREDLPDGLNFCKWTFTQTTTAPAFDGGCPTACGNGVVDFFEQCDDPGAIGSFPGCSATCFLIEFAQ